MGPQTWIYYGIDAADGTTPSIWVPITAMYTEEERLNRLSIPVSGNFLGVEGLTVITTVTPL